jgi:hypothetical protein
MLASANFELPQRTTKPLKLLRVNPIKQWRECGVFGFKKQALAQNLSKNIRVLRGLISSSG